MKTYPEHEKLKALGGANQIVGNFLESLSELGLELCEWVPNSSINGGEYFATTKSRDQILAEHFGIDREKLEAEKEEMLEDHRRFLEEKERS